MRLLAAACMLASIAVTGPLAEPATRTIRRHYTPADRNTGRYQYVPIDVPAGVESITIAYRYDDAGGASVIDLGLFEPGPVSFGTSSFRGYSGGAQRTITAGRTSSSPGYRVGPLPAGQWHVLLGLYKVAPAGVDVSIEFSLEKSSGPATPKLGAAGASGAGRAGRAGQAGRAGLAWYSGALHVHTTHSDGSASPAAVADAARAAGLDFVAITDHNNTFHTRETLPSAPLHIVGEEVTTPAGHANVWGLPAGRWLDFRILPDEPGAAAQIDALVASAHQSGGLFAINHPFTDCAGCSWEQTVPDGLDAIEIWNGADGPQDRAVAMWDRLLAAGRHVTAVGASDWHRPPAPIDGASVRVRAVDLTPRSILDGIHRGRVIVARDARIETPSMSARCGDQRAEVGDTLTCAAGEKIAVEVVAPGVATGRVALVVNGQETASKPIAADRSTTTFIRDWMSGYLRVQLYGADGRTIAVTNPVYIAARH